LGRRRGDADGDRIREFGAKKRWFMAWE